MAPDRLIQIGTDPVEVDLGLLEVAGLVVLAGFDDHERRPGGDGLPDPRRYVKDLSCVFGDDRVLHLHRLEDQELVTRLHLVARSDRDADNRAGQRRAHSDVVLLGCHVCVPRSRRCQDVHGNTRISDVSGHRAVSMGQRGVLNGGMDVALALTEADIRQAAGSRSFERGLGYLGAVEDLEIGSTEITATVYGNSAYQVAVAFGGERLRGGCTCPQGQEGAFCKHCVAVALSVLQIGDDLPRRLEAAQAQRQALESWLGSLPKEELLAELLGLLDDDRDLRRRFELRAASVNADAAAVRRAVRKLIALPGSGHLEHGEAYAYAHDVSEAATAI